MPRKPKVSVDEATELLKEFILLGYFKDNNFPMKSSEVWIEMSQRLDGKWGPRDVYREVREDRRKILSNAREEVGVASVNMGKDEDMVIVLVVDENADNFPAPTQIKEEAGENVEETIEDLNNSDDAEHLEEFDIPFVKEEVLEIDNNDQYLSKSENLNNFELDDNISYIEDEEYLLEIPEEESVNGLVVPMSQDISSEESEKRNSHRTKLLKPSQRYSYVKELKTQFPKLKNDQQLLLTTLVEIMKNTKPPPPPQDYYVMNGIMLECIECGHHSQSIMAARRHYQEKHGERYLFCYSCGVNFSSTTNLYKHEKRCDAPEATIVLRARALALGRKGRSRPYIPTHIDDKPKKKKFECSECSASFSSKYTLRAHLYMHRGERPHRCRLCAAAYTSRTALSRHMETHSDAEYICDHCKRSFKVKAALVTHMYTHRPENRFGCEECPKRYSQKHRNLPPPCACRLCPKRFINMPRKPKVSVDEATELLKEFILLGYFKDNNFPIKSSEVWIEMSRRLDGKWGPRDVYREVREDRRKILSNAREEVGVASVSSLNMTHEDTNMSETESLKKKDKFYVEECSPNQLIS